MILARKRTILPLRKRWLESMRCLMDRAQHSASVWMFPCSQCFFQGWAAGLYPFLGALPCWRWRKRTNFTSVFFFKTLLHDGVSFFLIHFLLLHPSTCSLSLYTCLCLSQPHILLRWNDTKLKNKKRENYVQVGRIMCENKIRPVRHYIVNPFFPVWGKSLQMMIDKRWYLFHALNVHCDVHPSVSIY